MFQETDRQMKEGAAESECILNDQAEFSAWELMNKHSFVREQWSSPADRATLAKACRHLSQTLGIVDARWQACSVEDQYVSFWDLLENRATNYYHLPRSETRKIDARFDQLRLTTVTVKEYPTAVAANRPWS